MSLAEQERAMFDLLFDAGLRQRFGEDRTAALQAYMLSPAEIQDFEAVRQEALAFDASLRSAILLAAIAKSLPLTFCGLSSFEGGVDRLRAVLDAVLVREAPIERPVQFAERLRAQLPQWPFADLHERTLMKAILDAEWGMAYTAAARRAAAVSGALTELPAEPVPDDWLIQPVRLASFVSAGVLPQSWQQLTQDWCIADGSSLWRALQKTPLSLVRRRTQLASPRPRLLLARAVVSTSSHCDPVIEHRTTDMPEGFATLFQYVNGENSVQSMLSGLQQAGAAPAMLEGVRVGFRQLLESGMLVSGWGDEE